MTYIKQKDICSLFLLFLFARRPVGRIGIVQALNLGRETRRNRFITHTPFPFWRTRANTHARVKFSSQMEGCYRQVAAACGAFPRWLDSFLGLPGLRCGVTRKTPYLTVTDIVSQRYYPCQVSLGLYFVSNGTPVVTAHSPVMCSGQEQCGVSPVRKDSYTPH